MLRAKDIYKSYGSLEVLRGVNLEIDKASITSIVGKSGTGKSTLLHILGTLDTPDKGSVIIQEENVFNLSGKHLARFRNNKIGFIFQFHHLIPEFNALENVSIPALINNVSKTEANARSKELLDYLGLGKRLDHKPSQLSGGELQRVAVARALVNSPAIIFADEPTGNLDTQTSTELHELLVKLKDDFGQSFVIVTHNQELADLSDRCYEMLDGHLVLK